MNSEDELVSACRRLLRRTGAMPGKGMELTQLVSLVLGEQEIQAGHLQETEAIAARPLAGKAYPADHRIWDSLYPPNHFRCRTTVAPMTRDEAEEDGFALESGWPRDPDTGAEFMPQHGFEGNIGKMELRDIAPGELAADRMARAEELATTEMLTAEEKRTVLKQRLQAAGIPLAAEIDRIPREAIDAMGELPGFVRDEGKAFYLRPERRVHMDGRPGKWYGLPGTLQHEVGHHVHYETGAVKNAAVNTAFRDAVTVDIGAWEGRARERAGSAFESLHTGQSYNTEAMDEHLRRHGIAKGEAMAQPAGTRLRLCAFFDTVGGMSKGKHGWGHSRVYYRRLDGSQGLTEVFANCYEAAVMGYDELEAEFPSVMAYVKRRIGL